jgi:hypothetical protein
MWLSKVLPVGIDEGGLGYLRPWLAWRTSHGLDSSRPTLDSHILKTF